MTVRARPRQVVVEQFSRELAGASLYGDSPYRGLTASPETLRLRVEVAVRGLEPYEVVLELDDVGLEVWTPYPGEAARTTRFALDSLETIFVAERLPRAGFRTWYGVYMRLPDREDQLVLETPDHDVARYIEHTIEQWLGLKNKPVSGEAV